MYKYSVSIDVAGEKESIVNQLSNMTLKLSGYRYELSCISENQYRLIPKRQDYDLFRNSLVPICDIEFVYQEMQLEVFLTFFLMKRIKFLSDLILFFAFFMFVIEIIVMGISFSFIFDVAFVASILLLFYVVFKMCCKKIYKQIVDVIKGNTGDGSVCSSEK